MFRFKGCIANSKEYEDCSEDDTRVCEKCELYKWHNELRISTDRYKTEGIFDISINFDLEFVFVNEIFIKIEDYLKHSCTFTGMKLARFDRGGCIQEIHNLYDKINSHMNKQENSLCFEMKFSSFYDSNSGDTMKVISRFIFCYDDSSSKLSFSLIGRGDTQ